MGHNAGANGMTSQSESTRFVREEPTSSNADAHPCAAPLIEEGEEGLPYARSRRARSVAAGSIALSGNIDVMGGLADLVAFIHQYRWSGRLHCVHESVHRIIEFAAGDVTSARSNHPNDRLGELVYAYGFVSCADLAAILASPGTRERLGDRLVARGLISPTQARELIGKQVEEIFAAVIELREGRFCFERITPEMSATPPTSTTISTAQLLLDTARRLDELTCYRARIASANTILALVPKPTALEALEPDLASVLVFVDGRRAVKDIARLTHLGELETTRRLFELIRLGLIEAREPAQNTMILDELEEVFAALNAA